MASYFLFLTAFIIFLGRIQKGLLAQTPESNNNELYNQVPVAYHLMIKYYFEIIY